jgi:hypothetical protein
MTHYLTSFLSAVDSVRCTKVCKNLRTAVFTPGQRKVLRFADDSPRITRRLNNERLDKSVVQFMRSYEVVECEGTGLDEIAILRLLRSGVRRIDITNHEYISILKISRILSLDTHWRLPPGSVLIIISEEPLCWWATVMRVGLLRHTELRLVLMHFSSENALKLSSDTVNNYCFTCHNRTPREQSYCGCLPCQRGGTTCICTRTGDT